MKLISFGTLNYYTSLVKLVMLMLNIIKKIGSSEVLIAILFRLARY